MISGNCIKLDGFYGDLEKEQRNGHSVATMVFYGKTKMKFIYSLPGT
jgi:hypothetical protein